jgi:hypothetical protein
MPGAIICDDVMAWAEAYTGSKFHAMLCDGPYEMNFMSKNWDRSGITFRPETWQALAQHLLPGAFIMAFASSRGYHRLACALEDAGLILHPTIFLWAYSQGFPKATRIDDARFAGHRYGGQALKPSAEPIIVAQKPYQGRPADSITATGAGSLWIEGSRVGTVGGMTKHTVSSGEHRDRWEGNVATGTREYHGGRFPANLALLHLPTCRPVGTRHIPGDPRGDCQGTRPGGFGNVGADSGTSEPNARVYGDTTIQAYACDPHCPIFRFDQQAGERSTGRIEPHHQHHMPTTADVYGTFHEASRVSYGDSGPASRFFPCFDWALDVAEQLAQTDPVFYAGKASRSERDEGLKHRNSHCSIKPISLCAWLGRLLLPPAAYAPRRLLVPFSGTSSEMIGAILAGWEDILGIEQDAQYVAIGQARLTYWDTQIAAQLSLF